VFWRTLVVGDSNQALNPVDGCPVALKLQFRTARHANITIKNRIKPPRVESNLSALINIVYNLDKNLLPESLFLDRPKN
jgi:hypothetical protein